MILFVYDRRGCMSNLKGIEVGTALGIAFIGLFCAIYISIGFNVIDCELQKFGYGYYRLYASNK
jgi:hypothetical protein